MEPTPYIYTCKACGMEREAIRRGRGNKRAICDACMPVYRQQYQSDYDRRPGVKERKRAAREKWIKDNPDAQRSAYLKHLYGITLAEYEAMLEEQGGVCAICHRPETGRVDKRWGNGVKRLAVDHCHTTGKVRGLLCHACNVTIGRTEENVARLEAMISYLRFHQDNS